MYKKDLKKLTMKELKTLASALKRSRDAAQNIFDRTDGVIKHNGGRKELKQHLGWYERQLNKVYAVITDATPGPSKSAVINAREKRRIAMQRYIETGKMPDELRKRVGNGRGPLGKGKRKK
tara:strand:+ start:778 stop:1140 length:363 start_codon:yes stop_codon:yes gene_type:complete